MRIPFLSALLCLLLALVPGVVLAVEVNQASAEQLVAVRGIGPKTAQIIIAERERAGPFASWSDLSDRVRGIGARKAAALQAAGLRITPPAPASAAPAKTAAKTRGARP